MDFAFEFDRLMNSVEAARKKTEKMLRGCPKEELLCTKRGNKPSFYYRVPSKDGKRHRVFINRDPQAQVDLARKAYLMAEKKHLDFVHKTLAAAKKEFKSSGAFEQLTPNSREEYLTKRYPLLPTNLKKKAVDLSDESKIWMTEPYSKNSMPLIGAGIYTNARGQRFRSRAELIIAGILDSLGLAYRYECEYDTNRRAYYPDFTIMHPRTGELYYLEYFGLMSDPDYSGNAIEKIAAYQRAEDAARFIYIFENETCPLDSEQVKNVLIRYFLSD